MKVSLFLKMVFMLSMWRSKGQLFIGMMNIGNNPSLTSKKHSIEVHIFDFDSDIYNEQIEVQSS